MVFYSSRHKNSLNALLGALQNHSEWNRIRVLFCTRESELLRHTADNKYGLILMSVMTPDSEISQSLLKQCRTLNSQIKICVGGPHITALPLSFQDCADWLVVGEAEDTLQDIISRTFEGVSLSSPRVCRPTHRVVLDRCFPSPIKLGKYGFIEITRGCPHGCHFCQTSRLFGTDVRHRSQEAIFEYCREMAKKKMTDIRFITPNGLEYGSLDGRSMNLNSIFQLLEGIKKIIGKPGRIFFGSFPSEIRPECITPESIQILREFTDSQTLVIGGQSGSNRMLARLHRGHTWEQVLSAAELSVQYGFKVAVDYIFGLPDENEEDQKATLDSMQQLIKLGATIHAHSFLPLPGTQLADAHPSPIMPFLRRFLGMIARDGFLFGQWQTQEKLALKMRRESLCS